MKKNPKKVLKLSQIYSYLEKEQCYLVQISLDSYDEIFNGWDAAPLKRRDLEPDLLDFIEQVGNDIPMRKKIQLSFQLPAEVLDQKKEESAIEAIYHNFTMIRHFITKELTKNNRKIAAYVTLGVLFLSTTFLFQNSFQLIFPVSIIFEGLFIGGWVMFWEAFSLFFFTGSELRSRRNRYIRYSNSKIEFQYKS
ncbi:MAG: hypothetical protein PHC62_08730 [Candidatus Izemoplasmatales bacterium]|nr:hypothetical protein [Candidatus Izemoplasmatales bacterium]